MPSNLEEAAAQFRQELLARERAAAGELVRAYGAAWGRIRDRLERLLARIDAAREAGEEISPAWLFQRGRLTELQRQVEAEIREFAAHAEETVRVEQSQAVAAAQAHAAALVDAGLVEAPEAAAAMVRARFDRLPRGAVEDLAGFLGDGSPLGKLFDELGPAASRAAREALLAGVATGQGPKVIARRLRQEMGGQLVRALTIARTETLRAYRESSRRTLAANADVVEGWTWVAGLGPRTCRACLAMHGTVHPPDERLDGHPNCRCTMVPRTKSWEELGLTGLPDTRPAVETGEAWLKRQPAAVQEAVLGKAGRKAWRAGEVELADFVGRKHHPDWGSTRFARSLPAARAAAAERASAAPIPGGSAGGGSGPGGGTPPGSGGPPAGAGGGPPAVPHNPDWEERVRQERWNWLRGVAVQKGVTPAEYEQLANEHLKLLLDEMHLFRREDAAKLLDVLNSGRFKTQFETGVSGGAYNPDLRRQLEATIWGIPSDAPDAERPIYGHLHPDRNGGAQAGDDDLRGYGRVAIRLRPELRTRTTFSGGDTADETYWGEFPELAPAPLTHPQWVAVSAKAGDVTRFPTAQAWQQRIEAEGVDGIAYVEAQLHGGVSVDDIVEVTFLREPPSPELAQALDAKGIPWRMYGP